MFLNKDIQALLDSSSTAARVYKSGLGSQAMLAAAALQKKRNVVVIVPGRQELLSIKALLSLLSPTEKENFWEQEWTFLDPSPIEQLTRGRCTFWAPIFSLLQGESPRGVVLTLENLFFKFPSHKALNKEYLYLIQGETLSMEEIVETGLKWGYQRVGIVTRPGEFAVRGDILDIFAPGYKQPVRLEFFGDLIERVRLFDPMSQRSQAILSEFLLLPVAPCVLGEEYEQEAREKWNSRWKTGDLSKTARIGFEEDLSQGQPVLWPGLYYREPIQLREILPEDALYLLADATEIRPRLQEAEWKWHEYLEQVEAERRISIPRSDVVSTLSEARETWLNKPQLLFESLTVGRKKEGIELPEKSILSFEDLFWKRDQQDRPWQTLIASLKEWSRSSNQVILSFHSERSRRKFLHLIEEEGLSFTTRYVPGKRGLFALISSFSRGIDLSWNQTRILAEDVLQPGRKKMSVRDRTGAFKGLRSFDEISRNDLLVHRDYGLARFGGLKRLNMGNGSNDFLLLQYANDDRLFLPVDRLGLVQKYKGPEGVEPALDKLGGVRWKNTKERVRKAIEKIAQDLVAMYAYRKVAKGYSYSPVSEMFREFEASFGFEETPDQAHAIAEVLRDMDQPEPMDRLVCGDVGFGKTEVALRAAFRAVMDGKQVALLCPTTVLAEQHYQNFLQRMKDFPVTVAMLSRFVPRAKQLPVLEAAKRGGVDILIGTHRILSKDVHLPNLGLLILDEEQRFGVKHKERVKKLRKTVDVLTLTATPIPRTLQLSLSGIRSLSVIETPPLERKPVETALIQREPEMLKGVLERELAREGQVFWVSNRVQGLERVREFVQDLVPEAKVGIAHGQMPERQLEQAMHQFWHGEMDVLVCTSIIESGLDFPKANTLVVDNAHMFGLGQLYQLRGRVGRSERQAYSYFVIPDLERLSEKARKRLQVILDMDYLGAGFQVAMEDLRLRGAGNILGEVQSGNIGKIGLDLFLEMLEQEVSRLKGEPSSVHTETELTIGFNANIPESYMNDSRERLKYYKALSTTGTEEGIEEIVEEIRDRFGPLPLPLATFVEVLRLKQTLGSLQVQKADLHSSRISLTWAEQTTAFDPMSLISWVEDRKDWAKLQPPACLELRIDGNGNMDKILKKVREELEPLTSQARQ